MQMFTEQFYVNGKNITFGNQILFPDKLNNLSSPGPDRIGS